MPDQPIVTTLALRSSLLLMSDHDGTTSAADAIVVDLASLAAASRDATRATADARIVAIALARREAHVRVSPARSGELLRPRRIGQQAADCGRAHRRGDRAGRA